MSEIEIYKSPENNIELQVNFDNETVWLNQYQLAELFNTDRTSIVKHLQNIYAINELDESATCAKFAQVQKEGKKLVTRIILFYNLDAIISVGYRVNQTFDKKELYPGIEEKSSMLLYLIIKNHSFIDGNKRIAASIFLWFLAINSFLFNNNGSKRITDNELVALCLMIASSNPKEKDLIIKVIIKLLTKN
ncbi:MAG: virulence RhuM family protein [Ignavibacteria bacterium]|nr:virulence RhuM family protein [Ignavibacteria bacterium]